MSEITEGAGPEREPGQERYFEVLTAEEAERILGELDLTPEGVNLKMVQPGDDFFDQFEAQQNLLYGRCGSDWEKYLELLEEHGLDPSNVQIDELRRVAEEEGVGLRGELPGFCLTAGGEEIIFFAIREDKVLEMAQKYARKEGFAGEMTTPEEGKKFLREVAEKYLLHEVGHVFYRFADQDKWREYIASRPDLQARVIEVQRDKYADEAQIPVAAEAFADFFIDYATEGRLVSRLGHDEKARKKMLAVLSRD